LQYSVITDLRVVKIVGHILGDKLNLAARADHEQETIQSLATTDKTHTGLHHVTDARKTIILNAVNELLHKNVCKR